MWMRLWKILRGLVFVVLFITSVIALVRLITGAGLTTDWASAIFIGAYLVVLVLSWISWEFVNKKLGLWQALRDLDFALGTFVLGLSIYLDNQGALFGGFIMFAAAALVMATLYSGLKNLRTKSP